MKGILQIAGLLLFVLSSSRCTSTHESLTHETRRGNLGQIRRIINTDENMQTSHLSSVLPLAAAMDRRDIVELLVRSGAVVNANEEVELKKNKYTGTALFIAASRGKKNIVEFLLKSGADFKIRGSLWGGSPKSWNDLGSNITPLYIASAKNHRGIAELLLREYGKKEDHDKGDLIEALLISARLRQTGIVDLFIKAGVDTQKAYIELGKEEKDHDAREIIKDRSRRMLPVFTPYHSLVDQCGTLQTEAKEVQKRYIYNRINRKLRSAFYRCSKRVVKKVCAKLLQDMPYKERKHLLKKCVKNAKECCSDCLPIEDFDKPYRCYSKQSLLGT